MNRDASNLLTFACVPFYPACLPRQPDRGSDCTVVGQNPVGGSRVENALKPRLSAQAAT
jgi:hypothetical protein